MGVFHALAPVERMGTGAVLLAGYLDLNAPRCTCGPACGLEQLRANPFAPVPRRHYKLHNLGNARCVVKLALHA